MLRASLWRRFSRVSRPAPTRGPDTVRLRRPVPPERRRRPPQPFDGRARTCCKRSLERWSPLVRLLSMGLGSMFDYYAVRGKRAQVAKSRQQEHKGKQRVVVVADGEV